MVLFDTEKYLVKICFPIIKWDNTKYSIFNNITTTTISFPTELTFQNDVDTIVIRMLILGFGLYIKLRS